MKSIPFSILLTTILIIVTSCKDDTKRMDKKVEEIQEIIKDTSEISEQLCYLYAVNKDSILLEIINTNDKVEGALKYNFYQIDGSSGTFNGIMKGDTLIGVYNFEAEGTQSRRELAFLKTPHGFVLGSGETELVQNTELFKKGTKFSFSDGRLLKSVDCDQ